MFCLGWDHSFSLLMLYSQICDRVQCCEVSGHLIAGLKHIVFCFVSHLFASNFNAHSGDLIVWGLSTWARWSNIKWRWLGKSICVPLCDVDCLDACNTCNTNIAQAGSLQVCSRCFDSLVMIPVFPPIIMSWPVWQMWSPGRDSKGNSELQLFLPYKISCIRGSLEIPILSLITRRLSADIWPGLARVVPMRSLARARDQVSSSDSGLSVQIRTCQWSVYRLFFYRELKIEN